MSNAPPASEAAPAPEGPLDPAMVAALHELLGPSPEEGMDEIVTTFASDADTQLDRMRAAVADGDDRALAGAAHALARSSGNLGARVVARLCRELEATAMVGEHDHNLATVERINDAVTNALSALARADFREESQR